MINTTMIEASIFEYITSGMGATSVSTGQPVDFDPQSENLDNWLLISDLEVRATPSRTDNRTAGIVLVIEACSRKRDVLNDAQRLMDQALVLLDRTVVKIHDYDSSDEPVIGEVVFNEPKITTVPRTLWQTKRAVIEGTFTGV